MEIHTLFPLRESSLSPSRSQQTSYKEKTPLLQTILSDVTEIGNVPTTSTDAIHHLDCSNLDSIFDFATEPHVSTTPIPTISDQQLAHITDNLTHPHQLSPLFPLFSDHEHDIHLLLEQSKAHSPSVHKSAPLYIPHRTDSSRSIASNHQPVQPLASTQSYIEKQPASCSNHNTALLSDQTSPIVNHNVVLPPTQPPSTPTATTSLKPSPLQSLQPATPGEWTAFSIPKTIVPSSLLPQPNTPTSQQSNQSHHSLHTQPKLRYSKGASASKYCHICGRNSKTVPVSQCANVRLGLCRKVVCEKCLIVYRAEIGPGLPQPNKPWNCTHCTGHCPRRARCHQYTKNNLRRRMKVDSKERKEEEQSMRNRARLALQEQTMEIAQVVGRSPL